MNSAMLRPMFGGMFLGGFECSTQRRGDRLRLDLIAATQHDELCEQDYALLRRHGFAGARDGFRWHLIERERGRYDWSSVLPMLQAARRQNLTVIWDLCHYGYPDWLDIWSAEFLDSFAAFCHAAVRLIRQESGRAPMICPVNEISFWAWIGGKEGHINPWETEAAPQLKRQLVRAMLAGGAAAREADPETVIVSAEPLINIIPDSEDPADIKAAEDYHRSQYEAVDLLLGRLGPELGGYEGAVDVVGLNYYPHNQWHIRQGFVPMGHHNYRPLSELLAEVHGRYLRPLFLAETGAENSARPAWISYVCQEVRTALTQGVPVHGICIYPITEYPGWDNRRVCSVGLFCQPNGSGSREVNRPLWEEIQRQQALFAPSLAPRLERPFGGRAAMS